MNEPGDNRLVRECLGGDEHAFEAILVRYQRPVFNVVLRMVRDRDDAGDVTQSAFLKAFERLSSFDPEQKFFSWLYRIAINEAINHLKRRSRLEPLPGELSAHAASPETAMLDADLSSHVQDALMSIATDYRAVLVLKHFEDCSYEEIGQIIGLPEKTIKSRLFTARRLLKERLIAKGVLR